MRKGYETNWGLGSWVLSLGSWVWAPGLEAFEDVGDELAGEVAAEALDGGGVFLNEGGEIAGGLVLFAVGVVFVLVEDAAAAVFDGDGDDQGDEIAGGLLGGGVVSEWSGVLLEDYAVEDRVGIGLVGGDETKVGAGGELAEHGLSECDFGVVGVGLGGEERDGEGLEAGGEVGRRADGVIAAAGEGCEAEGKEQKCTAGHGLWYRDTAWNSRRLRRH